MQIMPYDDAANYRFNPFDVTKVWPHKDYPPITVGRFVLDRNPENFVAQIVEAALQIMVDGQPCQRLSTTQALREGSYRPG
jgi:catalase